MAKLGDYVKIRTGKLDANASSENGQYPFFTCAIEPLKIDNYSYDCECVLVAGNGDLNVKYFNGKFDAYQRTYIIESLNDRVLYVPYLYCFLDKYVETLRHQSIGGVIKYIKLGNLTDAIIPIPEIEKQKQVATILSKVTALIALRKQQLVKLDELIKARFVEMFEDSVYPYTALTDTRFKGMNVTRGIAVIRYESKKIHPVYLNVYLNMDESQKYIKEHTRGATLQQINLADLRDLKVAVPPLQLQQVFATFVEHVDQQKQTVQQSLNKLELMKKALMQEYFG